MRRVLYILIFPEEMWGGGNLKIASSPPPSYSTGAEVRMTVSHTDQVKTNGEYPATQIVSNQTLATLHSGLVCARILLNI